MPWTAQDAYRHTKKASNPKLQRMWADVANSELEKTGDNALAIKAAKLRGGFAEAPLSKEESESNMTTQPPTEPIKLSCSHCGDEYAREDSDATDSLAFCSANCEQEAKEEEEAND